MLRLLLCSALVAVVTSQLLTVPAMKKVYKYADPALVTTLTAALNKDTTVAAQKTRLTSWNTKNAIKAGSKVTAGDPLGTAAGALKQAKAFMDHRDALKKYVTFQYNAFKAGFITADLSGKLRTKFWALDKTYNNDFNALSPVFLQQMVPMLPAAKRSQGVDQIMKVQGDFVNKNPTLAAPLTTFKF